MKEIDENRCDHLGQNNKNKCNFLVIVYHIVSLETLHIII
jgi:hypothetical protein